jgi:hypothetical protein
MKHLNLEDKMRLSDLILSKRRKLLKRNKKETKMSTELLKLQHKITYHMYPVIEQ